jgi:hypothetical protein
VAAKQAVAPAPLMVNRHVIATFTGKSTKNNDTFTFSQIQQDTFVDL